VADARAAPTWRARLRRWRNQALLALGLIALAAGVYLIGRAFLPRWWAHRVGDQVDGSIAAGIPIGLFYGFVFTALPLVALWWAFRRRRAPRWWLVAVAAGILLASPNLMTLGIVVGTGDAAHAGERTLDVEAPAFRMSVFIGALAALVACAFVYYLLFSRRHARGRLAQVQTRLQANDDRREEPPTVG
jgi:hypothetical protein